MDLIPQPSSAEVARQLQQARQRRDRGELDAAEQGLMAVLLVRPHLLAVECELARLRLERGDAGAVVRQVRQRQAFGLEPQDRGAWQELEALLLEALLRQERWAEAEPLLRSLHERGLASGEQVLALSRALAGAGRDDEGLAVLREALEQDSSALELQLELARWLRQLCRWPEAVEAFGRVVALAPEREELQAELRTVIAEALWQRGEDGLAGERWGEAEQAFRALADLEPHHPLARQRLELLGRLNPSGLELEAIAGLAEAGSWRQQACDRLGQFSRLLDRLELDPQLPAGDRPSAGS